MILFKLILLFSVLMLSGVLLTLALLRFNLNKFGKSDLAIKILFWIPIFIVYTFFVFSNDSVKLIGLLLLVSTILFECFRVVSRITKRKTFFIAYIIFFFICLLHLAFLRFTNFNLTKLLLTIGIASAVSDVTAFFFGKYFGKHNLPIYINAKKNWEGALGQLVGGFIGVLLVKYFLIQDISIFLFIPIGIGSAIGDLLNSYVKRKAGITYWSNFLPGHGGFIDRFSSLSYSGFITFYFLLLFE